MTAIVVPMGNLAGVADRRTFSDMPDSRLDLPAVFVDGSGIAHATHSTGGDD